MMIIIEGSKENVRRKLHLEMAFPQFDCPPQKLCSAHRLSSAERCTGHKYMVSYVSGYHADTPITIKAEPSIWLTAAFINIHEHPL